MIPNSPWIKFENHRWVHNNLVKHINVITNHIDVTSMENHFHHIGIHSNVAKAWEKHAQCSLDETETKLLASSSKPRIHEGFLEYTREGNWQNICILLIIIWFAFGAYKTYKY